MRDRFDIVVATDLDRGIGKDNALPWRIPGDLKYFKNLTTKCDVADRYNACIMGRKTWESIPQNHRPLSGRYNLVLTSNQSYSLPDGVLQASSLDESLSLLGQGPVERVFIIGGSQVYEAALKHDRVGLLYLTEVRQKFECDVHFPQFKDYFRLLSCSEIMNENGIDYCFKVFEPNILGGM